ncbi:MAG: aminodeoxychorismate/anthranilate synthase component II [Actinomycetaceae bacterium]|nr:aminodeoxychorismate/anthranilate synthase component II [Arcanobacterium sp.]MDD7687442.1 aminodeoxychorismate/anthranilate synthase component II [Actinomycetaceae bacterium]MDY5272916.1 aminodeoxychorismate/anthranilate synthase component II [Arcanobacterium sp.]
MILLIDNYDSFSYNLYQLIGTREPDIRVVRNDELTAAQVLALQPERIVISPGPGRPADAGICEELIMALSNVGGGTRIPLLGVCLGHQAICEAYGAAITYATCVMHGKSSVMTLLPLAVDSGAGEKSDESGVSSRSEATSWKASSQDAPFQGAPSRVTPSRLFAGLPPRIQVARYHSLVADAATIPPELRVTGIAEDGDIMAVEHRELPMYGVQFHPESILTPEGKRILDNFLAL